MGRKVHLAGLHVKVICQGNVWKVQNGRRDMSEAYDGVASPVGRLGIETIRPDLQAMRSQRWAHQVTVFGDPPFNPGSLKHYVSKNSAHSFSRYRWKWNEWHRRGSPHVRV